LANAGTVATPEQIEEYYRDYVNPETVAFVHAELARRIAARNESDTDGQSE
jgi:hypothetical protein